MNSEFFKNTKTILLQLHVLWAREKKHKKIKQMR